MDCTQYYDNRERKNKKGFIKTFPLKTFARDVFVVECLVYPSAETKKVRNFKVGILINITKTGLLRKMKLFCWEILINTDPRDSAIDLSSNDEST